MKRITQIEFVNYKAFYGQGKANKINIPYNKNLLIYGENGSGKSSIYEGLKQFFNSADNTIDVKPSRNIRVPLSTIENAGTPEEKVVQTEFAVKVEFTYEQGLGEPSLVNEVKTFGIPNENAKNTKYVQDANLLNGFLSYRELLRTYLMNDLRDKDEFRSKFASLLVEDILAKSKNNGTQSSYIKTWNDLHRKRGRNKEDLNEKFYIGLKKDIDAINIILNEVLNFFDKKLHVKILLTKPYIEYSHNSKTGQDSLHPILDIDLEVSYDGRRIDDAEENHLTILNEARLSSLAISIYLSALIITPQDKIEYKILFLDDIFIGLDMTNRLPLLQILTEFKRPLVESVLNDHTGFIEEQIIQVNGKNQYNTEIFFNSYQLFITTYDRQWYEIAKDFLGASWERVEIYAGEIQDGEAIRPMPVIIQDNLEPIIKARRYFDHFDYYSAGNNIRRSIEKILGGLLPDTYAITIKDLSDSITKLLEFYDETNCSDLIHTDLRKKLMLYKDVVFNPASHYDLRSPLYKIEIERAFEIHGILDSLPKLNRILLVGMRGTINYKYNNDEKVYEAQYFLKDNLYLVKVSNGTHRLSDPKHQLISYTLNQIPFCKKDTSESYDADKIKGSQNNVIRLSERLKRIQDFLTLADPVNIMEFTLPTGVSIDELINQVS